MPVVQILQLGSSRITGDFATPIADGALILVVILDFAAGKLQAFTVVPENNVSMNIGS